MSKTLCDSDLKAATFKSIVGAALIASCSTGYGQVVQLPDLQLQPNAANQSFPIFLQNGTASVIPVNGIIFDLQVEDGGPESGGSVSGPKITGIDVVTSTIFQGNHNTPSGGQVFPQLFHEQVSTSAGTVDIPTGSSQIATVTFDTTGFLSGFFTYTLNTKNQSLTYTTTGAPFNPVVFDGNLTVVPEPRGWVAVAGLACLMVAAVKRHSAKSGSR